MYKWSESHICSPFQEEIIRKQSRIHLWFLKAFLSRTHGSVPIKLGSNKHLCVWESQDYFSKKQYLLCKGYMYHLEIAKASQWLSKIVVSIKTLTNLNQIKDSLFVGKYKMKFIKLFLLKLTSRAPSKRRW